LGIGKKIPIFTKKCQMNNPLVSIIIPTYNRAHLIGETLDSVLGQTYTHWECIVVDGAYH
jgi:cellulose synthase/poly-beta-1,6-N-acetylglucosamine synthase-like glycosyltransferase